MLAVLTLTGSRTTVGWGDNEENGERQANRAMIVREAQAEIAGHFEVAADTSPQRFFVARVPTKSETSDRVTNTSSPKSSVDENFWIDADRWLLEDQAASPLWRA